MRYFVGFLMLVVGIATVLKTEWIIQNIGTNDWAEMKMSTFGGSRMLYKLMGIAGVLLGFMFIFDMQGGLIAGTVGKMIIK